MEDFIKDFSIKIEAVLKKLPLKEIAKALNILKAAYERDGRIYIFGNGGSLALATHWASDFNKYIKEEAIKYNLPTIEFDEENLYIEKIKDLSKL
jgi:phosphoheptose isomerase